MIELIGKLDTSKASQQQYYDKLTSDNAHNFDLEETLAASKGKINIGALTICIALSGLSILEKIARNADLSAEEEKTAIFCWLQCPQGQVLEIENPFDQSEWMNFREFEGRIPVGLERTDQRKFAVVKILRLFRHVCHLVPESIIHAFFSFCKDVLNVETRWGERIPVFDAALIEAAAILTIYFNQQCNLRRLDACDVAKTLFGDALCAVHRRAQLEVYPSVLLMTSILLDKIQRSANTKFVSN